MKVNMVLLGVLLLLPQLVVAAPFNQNRILDDREIEDYTTMTLSDIYTFLQERSSTLSYYIAPDFDGVTRTAPEIIWLASERYRINPKYTLSLLEKEQGLIEKKTPTQRDYDWATGYGICDSCTTTDPEVQKFKGFGKQIDNGVGFMRFFLDNPEKSIPFTVGVPVAVTDRINGTVRTYTVIPENQTTASLYKYTPHYQGNFSLWNIWRSFFAETYPDGSLVKIRDKSTVWLLKNGERRAFKSYGILLSRHNPKRIIEISDEDLATYPEGPIIAFPQYAYLVSPQGTLYLIIDDTKHPFDSLESQRLLGVNPEEVTHVTDEELKLFEEGKPITALSAYPTGALLQDTATGGVYYVENGDKFPIWSKEIMNDRYPKKRIIRVSSEELERYPTGLPVTFSDGTLVKEKESPTVYVISRGMRRPVPSEEAFRKLGYSWGTIITTSREALAIHPEGEPL